MLHKLVLDCENTNNVGSTGFSRNSYLNLLSKLRMFYLLPLPKQLCIPLNKKLMTDYKYFFDAQVFPNGDSM